MRANILILFLIFIPFIVFSQDENLTNYRNLYCVKNCKQYKYEQEYIKQNNPSLPPRKGVYPKFKRIFSIPLEQRNEIYPFNRYDSIYIASPNYIVEREEKRNYLDKKYHNSIRQISLNERDKLSDILFNYYELNSFGAKTGLFNPEDEDYCIQSRYPKFILLFMKNGKFEKYIAFPDEGFNRYNFTSKDYYQNFDWSYDKEDMILEIFKKDILPEEKCKK
ncbi:hypothetical protein [Epilithonimonas zeae]|uniref:hypothetical protein n=1 Tax=Epilithonimonas zeae TaxID=1416779 RepID=UPI002010B369|nr:hypothetical protein [Epilithonimonas zeae]UQB68104.1 hypothetical protein KI430_13850 [Epilithonimonas zeae]